MAHARLAAALVLAVALAALPGGAARAADADVREIVAKLYAAKTDEQRRAVVDAALAGPALDAGALAAALSAGRSYSAPAATGWVERMAKAPDGKERPYLLHVPAKYDPSKRYPLLLEMHGGVSRPAPLTHAELVEMKFAWGAIAESSDWIVLYPAGEAGCTWWDPNGSGMVLDVLRATRRELSVDTDRVVATGFSDGASGSYFLAAAHPTPFAAFVPLNGHPGVAQMGGTQIHLRNCVNRPIFAINTDLDTLYPAEGVKPVFHAMKALGAPTDWREVKGFGHDPSYLETERDGLWKHVEAARRVPFPKSVWWEGALSGPSRADWIRVVAGPGGRGDARFPDVNPTLTDARVRLGVTIDAEFAGVGARVAAVQSGSVAETLGIREGDVVMSIDDGEVTDTRTLRARLRAKKPGDPLSVSWVRGSETIAKKTTLPPAATEPAFERRRPWGTIHAEAKDQRIDVACAGISRFRVMLSPKLVDMTKPVEIVVNGRQAFQGVVAADPRAMLTQWLEDEDPSILVHAVVDVDVPETK